MATWTIDSPQRLSLDGEVTQLDVWFAHGKLRVLGTEGPARIEVKKVGRRGIIVTHENGQLSVRTPTKQGWGKWGPFFLAVAWNRNYTGDVIIAVPPTVAASLTVASGDVVASGLRRGVTVDVASGSITVMGLGGN